MTLTEFNEKFDVAYTSAMQQIDDEKLIEKAFEAIRTENGTSLEDIHKCIMYLSVKINKRTMRSVLAELLDIQQ